MFAEYNQEKTVNEICTSLEKTESMCLRIRTAKMPSFLHSNFEFILDQKTSNHKKPYEISSDQLKKSTFVLIFFRCFISFPEFAESFYFSFASLAFVIVGSIAPN